MTDFIFNWLPFVALVAACFFGAILLILGLRGMSRAKKLRTSGATTVARITDKTIKVRRREEHRSTGQNRYTSRTYFLSYAFQIDGKDYENTQVAPSDLWRTVEEGSEVEIIYYTADPSVNQLTASVLGVSGIAGGIQVGAGLVIGLGALIVIATSALDAHRGPDPSEPGANWVESYGVVRWVRVPEDPFMRIFAPDARRIYVEIGEMEPDKLYSERETLIYPYQAKGIELKPGAELRAFINPDNDFFSILEIESTPR